MSDYDESLVFPLGDSVGGVFDGFPFAGFADKQYLDIVEFESVGFVHKS